MSIPPCPSNLEVYDLRNKFLSTNSSFANEYPLLWWNRTDFTIWV